MNIKNIISKKLPENIAKSLHFRTGRYLDKLQEKENQAKESLWLDKFKDENSFEYLLEDGIKIRLYNDTVLSKMIYEGFEEDEILFLKKVLRPSDYFIDIGANIGLFSLYASRIVSEKGKVISFEPSPKTFNRFKENIEINGFKNITAVNQGLSDKPGSLGLYVSENGYDAWNSFAPLDQKKMSGTIEVPVTTLDNYLEAANVDRSKIAVVKIDVEGWEKFVLSGASVFLNSYSPTVLIEFTESNTFKAGYHVHELYDYLSGIGYNWYRYADGKLTEEKKQLNYPYDNLIATKNYNHLISLLS